MKAIDSLVSLRPFVGLLLILPLASVSGADLPTLTLEQALQRASSQNPTLKALQFESRAAEGLVEQAGLKPNPTLDITGENFLGTGRTQGVRTLETTIQASQLIERGGKRAKRVALATRGRELAEAEFALQRSEVLATSAAAYIELLAAQERLALAQAPLALARSTVTAVELRLGTGAASQAELARAKAALASALGEVARCEAAVQAARTGLAASWGSEPEADLLASGSIQIPERLPDQAALSVLLSRHPSLALQQATLSSQRASLELERANAAQDISVGGGLRFLRDGTDAAFVAGVSIPIAIHNRNQGNIRAARERVSGAEQGLHAAETRLRSRFAVAWQELGTAHATAVSLRREVLPATQEAYDYVRRAYEVGQLPLINVLDAQHDLVAVQREILEAETTYLAALARLCALTDPDYAGLSAALSLR
jgi:cobalt-zinc-cadmium efflux system outer membrane protein